jgi:hypothetical protein
VWRAGWQALDVHYVGLFNFGSVVENKRSIGESREIHGNGSAGFRSNWFQRTSKFLFVRPSRTMKNKNAGVQVGVAMLAICGASCCELERALDSKHICRQDEAGSAHIAVLAVGRWDKYVDAVQPTFQLSAADALQTAIPTTTTLEEKVLDALSARAKVALPSLKVTDTTNETESSTADPTATHARREETTSGDTSSLSFGNAPQGTRTAAALPGIRLSASAIRADPMLQYWAATALYQEVQLLNRYLKNAAISEEYEAYVVRLQVSLLPRRRDLPYDADAIVSFFYGDWEPDADRPFVVANQMGALAAPPAAAVPGGAGGVVPALPPKNVRIVPLLVTDNLEATLHSRSVDQVRELALTLSAVVHGVGVGGDLQKFDEQLRTVLTRDLNSTFTVARMSDNTLRCRFGAVRQGATDFAMIPQTHNVSLLVLIHKNYAASAKPAERTVRLACRTKFINVATGEELAEVSKDGFYETVASVLRRQGVNHTDDAGAGEAIRRVVAAAASNNFEAFGKAVNALHEGHFDKTKGGAPASADSVKYLEAIWTEVVAARIRSQFSSATLEVPVVGTPSILNGQTPLLMDMGKGGMNTTLRGGAELRAGELMATLTQKTETFVASGISVADDGREVRLAFPSFQELKRDPSTDKPVLHLYLRAAPANDLFGPGGATCAYQKLPDQVSPAGSVVAGSPRIVARDGQGAVRVVLSLQGDSASLKGLKLSATGADLVGVEDGAPVARDPADGRLTITVAGKSLEVGLKLSNLTSKAPVRIILSQTAATPTSGFPIISPEIDDTEATGVSNRSGASTP